MNRLHWLVCGSSIVLASSGSAQVTQRVSLASSGAQGNYDSYLCSLSADGRCVAFASGASNLVLPPDSNGFLVADVFLRDRLTGTTERVSVDSNGIQGNNGSIEPWLSGDGRYVVFKSRATNLVPGDTTLGYDVFLRDRQSGTTARMSVATDGTQANDQSEYASISADGRFVVFDSYADNLVAGDTNHSYDVFLRDLVNGTTERVNIRWNGVQSLGDTNEASISADGRFVAFTSDDTYMVYPGSNSVNIYVRDRLNGTNERVSVDANGYDGATPSFSASISGDGRFVAFASYANNFVPGDTNDVVDVFVKDRLTGAIERVSVRSNGVQGNDLSYDPSISADGRYVSFTSLATNLVPGDTNGLEDTFVHDRQTGTTERVNVGPGGEQGNAPSYAQAISGDGRLVAFQTAATNLVPADTNGWADIFVRDRLGGPAFISLCDPGAGGVLACPCANPPSGPFRGCDNSAATGGAILIASGGTTLSSDSLYFWTVDEKPSALSTVWQGPDSSAGGIVYGQGVRCVSGPLKRLYHKTAVAGGIKAPDFTAGDPTVSARSAALGVQLQPGQSWYYFVSYRDPTVLGGCPGTSTFNATQTGVVTWSP